MTADGEMLRASRRRCFRSAQRYFLFWPSVNLVICLIEVIAFHGSPWQLADSAFPAGGFAHSSGLEAAWQQGEVNAGCSAASPAMPCRRPDTAACPSCWRPTMNPGARRRRCPVRRLPAQPGRQPRQPRAGPGVDRHRRALLPSSGRPRDVRGGPGAVEARHHSPIFGAALRTLGVDRDATARLFLFGVAAARSRPPSAWASSAPRTDSGCWPSARAISIGRWRRRWR